MPYLARGCALHQVRQEAPPRGDRVLVGVGVGSAFQLGHGLAAERGAGGDGEGLGPPASLAESPATGCGGRSLRLCSRWAPRPLGPGVPGWRCPRSPPARWSRSSSACRSAPGTGSSRLRPSPRCGRAPRALWCPWQGGGSAAASGKAARPTGEPPTPFPHGGRATAPVGTRVAVRSAAGAGPAEPTGSPPAPDRSAPRVRRRRTPLHASAIMACVVKPVAAGAERGALTQGPAVHWEPIRGMAPIAEVASEPAAIDAPTQQRRCELGATEHVELGHQRARRCPRHGTASAPANGS